MLCIHESPLNFKTYLIFRPLYTEFHVTVNILHYHRRMTQTLGGQATQLAAQSCMLPEQQAVACGQLQHSPRPKRGIILRVTQ